MTIPDSHTACTRLRNAGCVFAEDEAQLLRTTARTSAEFTTMLEQRIAGLPLEHVLGWAEFSGLRITVQPDVFIPRRRTEQLAHQAIRRIRPGMTVVDLCCGAGAVATAIAATENRLDLHATDIDPDAVDCARANLAAYTNAPVHHGDLYDPLPTRLRNRIDIIVANAPYVPTPAIDRLPREARLHEPRTALDGGPDGTDILQRVIAQAPHWLTAGGRLLVEASEQQTPRIVDAITDHNLTPHVPESDDPENRVVVATKPASPEPC